jgi:hypothetical protein
MNLMKNFPLLVLSFCSLFLCAQPTSAYLLYDDSTLYIDQPVAKSEWSRLKQKKIEGIVFWEGGDSHLFDTSESFPKLREVALNFDGGDSMAGVHAFTKANTAFANQYIFTQLNQQDTEETTFETLLKKLSRSYPGLKSLEICRLKPISCSESQYLKAFPLLENLTISGPLDKTCDLSRLVPSQVKKLWLSRLDTNAISLPAFKNLRELLLYDCKYDDSFFTKLCAPSLRLLKLQSVKSAGDSLSKFKRFKKLQEIEITYGSQNVDDLKTWDPALRIERVERNYIRVFRKRPE